VQQKHTGSAKDINVIKEFVWFGVRKSIWPVKKSDEVLECLSVCSEVQMICKYGPADATATPSYLASLKSRLVYLSDAGLLRLSWKRAKRGR